MKRAISAFFLCISILLAFNLGFAARAEDTETSWTDYAVPVVPVGDVYSVTTAEQLAWIGYQVTFCGNNFAGKTVFVENDIDLSAHAWIPIGHISSYFSGTFDGNNKIISNVKIGSSTEPNTINPHVGFFGLVNQATLKNIGLSNAVIYSANSYASGLLVGECHNSSIDNCHVEGTLNVTDPLDPTLIGGFSGHSNYSDLLHCSSSVTLNCNGLAYPESTYIGKFLGAAYSGSVSHCNAEAVLAGDISSYDLELIGRATDTYLAYDSLFDKTPIIPVGDLYTVSSAEELAWVACQVNLGALDFQGKTIKIADSVTSIDLSAHEWLPIGSLLHSFKGTFDGNNKLISNIRIGSTLPHINDLDVGFFGRVESATLLNIKLSNVAIDTSSTGCIGLLAGGCANSTVTNCSVTGELKVTDPVSYSQIGAFVGGSDSSELSHCSSNATMECIGFPYAQIIYIGKFAGKSNYDRFLYCRDNTNLLGDIALYDIEFIGNFTCTEIVPPPEPASFMDVPVQRIAKSGLEGKKDVAVCSYISAEDYRNYVISEIGMLVIKSSSLSSEELVYNTANASKVVCTYLTDFNTDQYSFSTAVWDIPNDAAGQTIVMRPYVIYDDNGITRYAYGAQIMHTIN